MLSRMLDDELSARERLLLEEHLSQCPGCQAEHAAQQRVWALLTRVEAIAPPDVFAAVEARLSERGGWASLLDGLQLRRAGYALAAAALVGLSVWSGVWAGAARHRSAAGEYDRAMNELLADTLPGMEVVTLLDHTGERR
jgi:anti-sigma factor RsiW